VWRTVFQWDSDRGNTAGDDDVAGVQPRAEEFLDILQEQGSGHGAICHHWSGEVIMTQPGNGGGGVPMSVRNRGDAPFTTRGASVAPNHVRRRPSFIQRDQRRDVQRWVGGLPLTPCGMHVGAILLAGL